MIEVAHGSQEASGYRSLVNQIKRGLAELGEEHEDVRLPEITERLAYSPKDPILVDVSRTPGLVTPRWADRTTLRPVMTGTKFRRWVSDRDMPWSAAATARIRESGDRDATRLVVDIPEHAEWDGAARRILFTMWESSELPVNFRPWAPHLRRVQMILVPCEHNRRLVRRVVPESRVQVRVVPLALEKDSWPFFDRSDRPADAPFVFLMNGDLSTRKGFHIAYKAFMDLFEGNPHVHLVFKTRGQSDFCAWGWWPKYVPVLDEVDGTPVRDESGELLLTFNKERVRWKLRTRDPNVHVLRGDWSRKSLLRLYQIADCFLWPSRGEGWGYPPREAAATGLPVITCAHTGMHDAAKWAITIPHRKGKVARYSLWGPCGHWLDPDEDALKSRMLWVYENRTRAFEQARSAAEYVTRRTPADLAQDILALAQSLGDTCEAQ